MYFFEIPHVLALINLVLCAGIAWCCVCRIQRMSARSTRKLVRAAVAVLMGGAAASGFSPILFSEWPGPGHLVLSGGMLFLLVVSAREWRDGLPSYARSDMAPLETTF